MTTTPPKRKSHVSWQHAEYLWVACAMLPLIAKGKSRMDAIKAAQRLLPKERQRPVETLHRNLGSGQMSEAFKKAHALTEAQRAGLIAQLDQSRNEVVKPAPTPPKIATPPAAGPREFKRSVDGKLRPTTLVRWKPLEWALLARRVAYYQRELQDKRVLSRLIKVAQDIELPPERRRSEKGIDSGMTHQVQAGLVEGLKISHELLADVPFDPNRTTYVAPGTEPAEAAEPESVYTYREPSPGVNIDAAIPRAVQAPEPVAAPTPAPIPRSAVAEPVRAFGEVFAQGMSDLIEACTARMVTDMELRLMAMSERLMARAIERVEAGMLAAVPTLVHGAIQNELGPVGNIPPLPFPRIDLPQGVSLPDSLQLDVVGLLGSQANEVKKQLNGYGDSIRFIDADHVDSWTPRKMVVLNTKFISHNAEGKCRKFNVKPIRVQGGAGAIVSAVRELYAQEGFTLPY